MLAFLGENYYLDIDELERQVSAERSVLPPLKTEAPTDGAETDGEEMIEELFNEQQISLTRYETFKSLIDVILTEREDIDEGLGIRGAKDLTVPFRIAFNTLLINNIIKTL